MTKIFDDIEERGLDLQVVISVIASFILLRRILRAATRFTLVLP